MIDDRFFELKEIHQKHGLSFTEQSELIVAYEALAEENATLKRWRQPSDFPLCGQASVAEGRL